MHTEKYDIKNVRTKLTLTHSLFLVNHVRRSIFFGSPTPERLRSPSPKSRTSGGKNFRSSDGDLTRSCGGGAPTRSDGDRRQGVLELWHPDARSCPRPSDACSLRGSAGACGPRGHHSDRCRGHPGQTTRRIAGRSCRPGGTACTSRRPASSSGAHRAARVLRHAPSRSRRRNPTGRRHMYVCPSTSVTRQPAVGARRPQTRALPRRAHPSRPPGGRRSPSMALLPPPPRWRCCLPDLAREAHPSRPPVSRRNRFGSP